MAARAKSQKNPPKEKIVQRYEWIFSGEDVCRETDSFWHELLLLRPRIPALWAQLRGLTSPAQLERISSSLRQLCTRCVHAIEGHQMIQCAHALQTLTALLVGLGARARAESGASVRPLEVLMGEHTAHQVATLSRRCCELLQLPDSPDQLKQLCVQQLLALILLPDSEVALPHVITGDHQLVPVILQLLGQAESRAVHGDDCVLLVTLLLAWRREGGGACGGNPCRSQLAALQDELVMNGLGQVITARLAEFNWRYSNPASSLQGAGWFSSITSAVGSVFSGSDDSSGGGKSTATIHPDSLVQIWSMLLALYECVLLSRVFLSTLTQAATDTASLSSSSTTPSPRHSLDRNAVPPSSPGVQESAAAPTTPPANLLSALIEFCSLTMRQTSVETAATTVRLCFTVLTCVVEDHYCNSLLHDANLVFTVPIHRVTMRHRRLSQIPLTAANTTSGSGGPQPLCVWLLELAGEFMVSHLMQRLPVDLYRQCVGVVHRLLCYQKHCRVRLAYQWRHLWSTLVALLRFIVAHEQLLCDVEESSGPASPRWPRAAVLRLCTGVVNIFNLFITYGDTFLATPTCYDQLYYELVRDSHVFASLYALSVRHAGDTACEEASTEASRLSACLINIRAIGNHFSPKIDAWLAETGSASASEAQVFDLVRNNYESLTLKLQQSLDMYTAHAENEQFTSLFHSLLRQTQTFRAEQMCSTPLEIDHTLLTSQLSCIN